MANNTSINFELTEDQRMLQQMAREFSEKEIKPHVLKFDEAQEFPFDIVNKMGEMGFLGAMIPTEYGGAGLSVIDFVLIMEELAKVDPSVALTLAAHHGLCLSHLYTFANEEQRKKYVPDLATGKKIGAWGLTEPSSGSDAGGMKTTVIRDGDFYVLNGSKNFITNASYASTFVIMSMNVDDKGKKKHTAFIVEKDMPGFSIGRKENKLGFRASDTAQLIFENVRVPSANRLGNEGDGFHQALATLDGGRIGIAALSVGIAQGCLDASIKYAKERSQFGKTLGDFQAVQWKLADMQVETDASRLLTFRAAMMKMEGKNVNKEAAIAKYFASETCCRAANEAVQIHGGYGFTKDFPVEKFYRDAKLMTIGEGTSEVQKMVIAKNIFQ
ncbi:MAG: acyl-CoA dehydrogenase family protein [Ignavibacteriales bacterium]|nr:acyl-CoA dehydrogenase family protein [Ignavibacteriales bacterium]